MKQALSLLLLIIGLKAFSQGKLEITTLDGGTVVTKLSGNIAVNKGSSLNRTWIVINNPSCPAQIDGVGINAVYTGREYNFKPVGEISAKEPITAYEIHHVLYNVFGEHVKTLSNQDVVDIDTKTGFSEYASWYASENQISEYLIAVSYVANIRTAKGIVWQYGPSVIEEELRKIRLTYNSDYFPKEVKQD